LIEEYDDDAKALSFKNEGNQYFRNKNFTKAIEYYNKSLQIKEDPVLYCNRSAANYQIKKYV
jgi:tetratricopeptide (TPR) repeat protein